MFFTNAFILNLKAAKHLHSHAWKTADLGNSVFRRDILLKLLLMLHFALLFELCFYSSITIMLSIKIMTGNLQIE